MIYQKHDFENGDILTADQLNYMEDGIANVYDDLYDVKTDISYDFVHQTTNIASPKYTNEYSNSTFSGWWGCVGKPQNFNRVRFPVKVRSGHPLSSITVRILEMPNASEVTAVTLGVTPSPKSWKVIASTVVKFDESPAEGAYQIISADFDEIIENSDGKYLFLAVLCDDFITMGFFKSTYDDIEYNPWIYYATNGGTNSTYLGVGTYDYNSKVVYTLAADFYLKSSNNSYIKIGTSKRDKFFDLVNECINNSESFGQLFKESYKSHYVIGSQNLVSNNKTTSISTTSTFTGVIFPIGVVSKDMISDGCLLKIRARSYNGSTAPITKVWAYLYSVESIPYAASPQYEFSTLGPTLLRSGMAKCDIPIDTDDVVAIKWNEGEFSNIDGKFLMLGYCCDTYNYRCFNAEGKSGAAVCSSIDGNKYSTTLETWYSTTKDGSQSWRPHWVDSRANAWSLITTEKYYDLGEKFYELIDNAVEEALADGAIDVKTPPTSEVRLAKQYDLVVGDTFQLYYDGVVKTFDASKEGITVRCSKGEEYSRYWEYTPSEGDEGTYTLTLYTRQLDGTITSSGTTKIVVHSKLTNETTPDNLTCLIFGDSLTSSASWAAEGFRRIYGTNASVVPASLGVTNTITTYGSKNNTHNNFKIYHEGYGGWTWNSFLTPERGSDSTINGIVVTLANDHGYDINVVQKSIWTDNNGKLWELEDLPSNNQIKFNRGDGNNETQKDTATPTTLSCDTMNLSIAPTTVVWETDNPFYNEVTQSLDFNAHAAKYGAGDADIVACLLTWNGAHGMSANFRNDSIISGHMDKASRLFKAIHEDLPNAKIICMGIQLSSITGGSGYNYGAKGGYSDTWASAFYAFDYNKALESLIVDDPELCEYCYYVDTKGQFDTRYCMPYKNVAVNTRVSEETEIRGVNGVHPSKEGYYQIGDAFYRALTKVIPTFVDKNK